MARLNANSKTLGKLRVQWGIFLFVGLATIIPVGWLTRRETFSTLWLFLATFVFLHQSIIFYLDLDGNHTKNSKTLLSGFGLSTWLSLLRLLALSLLAGFLVAPRPAGWLAWVPFTLYLFFNLIDLIDGYAARRWGQVTRLGEKLDLDLDGRGMLVGSLLAVLSGAAGWWYLLVGMARYFYVFGIWLRKRLRLPVIEKANQWGRPLAGLQMGVGTALLAPALHPPYTIWISTLVMVPFLANFIYDWLLIGRKRAKHVLFSEWVTKLLPLILRAALVPLLAVRLYSIETSGASLAIEVLIMAGFLFGAGVRVLGLVLLIQVGLDLHDQLPRITDLIISFCSLVLVYLGPGAYSLWQPESSILRRRLGER